VKGTFGAMADGSGVLGFVVLFMASGVLELAWREDPSKEPGNFNDPGNWQKLLAAVGGGYSDDIRTKEISNGRMAMLSVLGIWAAELATGKDAMQQFGLPALGRGPAAGARPGATLAGRTSAWMVAARGQPMAATATIEATAAVEEETPVPPPFDPAAQLGAVAPLGYFDPLGFAKKGDEEGFRKLRAAELKHGRVAMMASIGALGEHFFRFPGFENVKGTFGAMADGSGVLGFVVIFIVSGVLELAWQENPSKAPGNFGDPGNFQKLFAAVGGGYSDDIRNKEISNGRMAMLSVLGICVAELATGKDALQQFGL